MMMNQKITVLLIALLIMPVFGLDLPYHPSPADNPLKGLVPYVEQHPHGLFPHSLEFHYFPLSDFMGRDKDGVYTYNWAALEKTLDLVTGRRCQLIFRVYLEYPGKPSGVPKFLLDDGVPIIEWNHPNENKDTQVPGF